MHAPFLTGERVFLRAVTYDDVDRFVAWLNDQEVNRYLERQFPLNAIREREWVESQYKSRDAVSLALVLKEEDRPIGVVGLDDIDPIHRNAEFGIFIGDKASWDKGYGTEAARLMVRYGFDTLNLERISLRVFDYNTRAIRAYEKVGFRKEGVLRRDHFSEGAYHDTVIMGILREERKDQNT